MHNLMQDLPLRVGRLIDHAARFHTNRPVLGRSVEGPIVESTWGTVRNRALRVAQTLSRQGFGRGDAIGVMGWNTIRMLELWYGVPGSGAALHTLNPRLSPEQMVYIINHAEDRLIFVDLDLVPLLTRIRDQIPGVREIIVLTDAAHMPEAAEGLIPYEDWLADADGDFAWVEGDERDACGICYTSGTTGNPKGVVYTHRSNMLHALAVQAPDAFNLGSSDTIMPVVPLFHANGWCTGYIGPLVGASMVLPGRDLTPPAVYDLLERGVTFTAAVPTVWLGLLAHLDANDLRFSTLKRVAIGGSSCPRAVIERFQDHYGVEVLHAWGMTETSPIGTTCSFKPEIHALSPEERLDIQETVGHPPFTVDLKLVDDDGSELPWDGRTQGRLLVRGDAVARRYLKADADALDTDGWFDTGDVATVTPHGYVRITDRSKDIIKSGGEWISSIALENAAVAHPDVAEAAAVAWRHPKWGERPVLAVVPRPGTDPDPESIRAALAEHFAKWQLPDEILFMAELPHTATGKISKRMLRMQLQEDGFELTN
ncbi:long-chain fatty acid--CoA ligase [Amaricoccus macauensis]|uniref:long-chain fatty acid--CoA ligase n=1 Tax=Amaricoccus macauensis TaxID=57001 RepID=UPI003C7A1609